jgi:hypothetical protein
MLINENDNLLKAVQLMIRLNHISIHDAEINLALKEKYNICPDELTMSIETLLIYDSVLSEDMESASANVEISRDKATQLRIETRKKIKDYAEGFAKPSIAAES